MKKPVLYAASPLGFSEAGRAFYKDVLLLMYAELGFDVRDPWALAPQDEITRILAMDYGTEKRKAWQKLNRCIGEGNAQAIRESDIVAAVLDGVDVDSGTASEIGFAAALGKRIEGYRGDFRLSADNEGSIVNLQVEYFIHMSGGGIVETTVDLKKALKRFVLSHNAT